ncbi:hypothetical protein ACIQMJ_23385 [Actinosynnema sp. NPDC091369]
MVARQPNGRAAETATSTPALTDGRAVEIVTGAPVPDGATAVIPVEDVGRVGAPVTGGARPGRHIRRTGESCPAGELLLPAGTVVTPAVLGPAASVGHDTLPVHRRPRVAAVPTGDEVVTGGLPGPGRVRDAIGPLLPGLTCAAGGEFTGVTYLADYPGALVEALHADVRCVVGLPGNPFAALADGLAVVPPGFRGGEVEVLPVAGDGRGVQF